MILFFFSLFFHILFLSFIRAINKTALPFVRLTLSGLTFASLVLGGKTREDLLFPNTFKHNPNESDYQPTVEHA